MPLVPDADLASSTVSSNRSLGLVSVLALVFGLGLLIVPALLRDGICGLTGCADQVPDIAVTRTAGDEVAVLVPAETAGDVSSVRLLEGGNSGSREWVVTRESPSTVDAFVVGGSPEGFSTVVPLSVPVQEGAWVAEVTFACTTASLPFSPESISIGQVRSWQGVTEGAAFSSAARTTERCATERDAFERALFLGGAALATIGAVLGVVVVLRRPPRDPEDPGDWAPTTDGVELPRRRIGGESAAESDDVVDDGVERTPDQDQSGTGKGS